jgi:hypothetical protein
VALKRNLIVGYQRGALVVAHAWYRLTTNRSRRASISWVVGADDVASMVLQISGAIPHSFSVSFFPHASYANAYGYSLRAPRESRRAFWQRVALGPWLLARLMVQARGFIYVGSTGFLFDAADHREFEFRFLKKHGLGLVCYWCGSDIRSTKRMNELERTTGMPNISTYIGIASPALATDAWDAERRAVANAADAHADAMFSNSVDHLSYLRTATEPFLYFLDEESIGDLDKFTSFDRPVIVHATTSPVIKGTPLVRAAITQLREEGYDFEYQELIGVPNTVVRENLARAHIALNQFYGFSTAVFGAEALASGAVVMMSADENVETDLPPGSNNAWVVTKHYQVYSHLKALLDEPGSWAEIAAQGIAWARENVVRSGTAPKLARVLDAVLDGTYTPPRRSDA